MGSSGSGLGGECPEAAQDMRREPQQQMPRQRIFHLDSVFLHDPVLGGYPEDMNEESKITNFPETGVADTRRGGRLPHGAGRPQFPCHIFVRRAALGPAQGARRPWGEPRGGRVEGTGRGGRGRRQGRWVPLRATLPDAKGQRGCALLPCRGDRGGSLHWRSAEPCGSIKHIALDLLSFENTREAIRQAARALSRVAGKARADGYSRSITWREARKHPVRSAEIAGPGHLRRDGPAFDTCSLGSLHPALGVLDGDARPWAAAPSSRALRYGSGCGFV
jgi:hypothetical protein